MKFRISSEPHRKDQVSHAFTRTMPGSCCVRIIDMPEAVSMVNISNQQGIQFSKTPKHGCFQK